MSRKNNKIQVEGSGAFGQNPFDSLNVEGLPAGDQKTAPPERLSELSGTKRKAGRKRIEIRREKSGRGGKTVTVITGMERFSSPVEREDWALRLRKSCSTGGTIKEGKIIELQGDQREKASSVLKAGGFDPVFAGG